MNAVPVPVPVPVPDDLTAAFLAYERALMSDDVAALDRLFAPGPDTLRGDVDGLLVGHDAIAAFRASRGGAPPRRVRQTHVRMVDDDHALIVAVTEPERGGRGQQTQLWTRTDDGWRVSAAHVSVSGPAVDPRVWRVVGTPLVPGAASGPLRGERVAVKDLYAVAGQRVGAGNPAWLAAADVEGEHAGTVAALLDAGAEITGISRTDELAYSLAGTNRHYGTPPNPAAPGRVPGGSSSGSASAVALGQVSIGLGTDTGGSIRVPAAYQGLYGIRTSHDAVPRDGLLALAPAFDTVGWLTRSAELLERVGDVLLPPGSPGGSEHLVVVPELLDLAEPEVAAAVGSWLYGRSATTESWDLDALPVWLAAFQLWQAWQAWEQHAGWLTDRLGTLGDDVRGRFEHASGVTPEQADAARATVATAGRTIRDLVGDRVLVLPSAATVAPALGPGLNASLQSVREATMRLTCVAGLGGLPAVGLPLTTSTGLPCGVCLVAAPGRDRDLLALAVRLVAQP